MYILVCLETLHLMLDDSSETYTLCPFLSEVLIQNLQLSGIHRARGVTYLNFLHRGCEVSYTSEKVHDDVFLVQLIFIHLLA